MSLRELRNRRAFLVASTTGMAGLAFGAAQPTGSSAAPWAGPASASAQDAARSASAANGKAARTGPGRAKSTILFFLSGGASHIDMWDMKPQAPVEYRGPFQPIATSAPGVTLCEHLPLLAKQAHRLALINSVSGKVSTNDHHAGYYYNLTGHVPDPTFLSLGNNRTPYADDWPSMGAVVGSRRPQNPRLPNFITLPQKEGAPAYTRPGQFAARLGLEHEPLYIEGDSKAPLKFHVPALQLRADMPGARLTERHALLRELDANQRDFEAYASTRDWTAQQQRALTLLLSSSTTEAFDVAREPAALRERYGENVNGMSLLA
ncbi:MAG: DUF1501 domain-containing protein, partial [Planctomycetota bacterium]